MLQIYCSVPKLRLTYLLEACASCIIGETNGEGCVLPLIRVHALTSISIINQEENWPMSFLKFKSEDSMHIQSTEKRHTQVLTIAYHLASCSVISHMLILRDSWQLWQNINYCHPTMYKNHSHTYLACHIFTCIFFNSLVCLAHLTGGGVIYMRMLPYQSMVV